MQIVALTSNSLLYPIRVVNSQTVLQLLVCGRSQCIVGRRLLVPQRQTPASSIFISQPAWAREASSSASSSVAKTLHGFGEPSSLEDLGPVLFHIRSDALLHHNPRHHQHITIPYHQRKLHGPPAPGSPAALQPFSHPEKPLVRSECLVPGV
ncbi:hypothetical protein CORC01_13011 [Colletotrichum orchidophilum]|uniref:Uncharacterized protein n=1 Tax=Colletotrichum orchidophilum TaxID=1209926 RepID=A0A1G4ARD7_9PEZI|nr:uncharacterized protein CORC01_13011 [Colletotrichum orchidophilum]OHE91720.1 hypothetical protein CORC01_13011 [Colletotrichum orchidophilum]